MKIRHTHIFVSAMIALFSQGAAAEPPTSVDQIGEYYKPGSGYFLGYLAVDPQVDFKDYPDGRQFIPPAPAPDSLTEVEDEAAYQEGKRLRQTARGKLAIADAELKSATATQMFACVMGVSISEQETPHLNALLRRSLNDAALTGQSAKETYKRARPFRTHGEASCTPEGDAKMKDDSYPSGHAAIGWAWGLILSQIAPEKQEELLVRGFDYGQSRVICGVHWQSDVDAGRLVGAAAVARLQSNPVFREQLELARQEVASARQKSKGTSDCTLLTPVE